MRVQAIFLAFAASLAAAHSHGHEQQHQHDQAILAEESTSTSITLAIREKWMRVAIQALHDLASPCPFSAFGAAIVVNHKIEKKK